MRTFLGLISALYAESHRHYHTISHIASMLELGKRTSLSENQILAIWLHDSIYDPHSSTNEEDSAAFADRSLREQGYPEEDAGIVRQVILDTKKHIPSIPESKIVIDLDMAILGGSQGEYGNYKDQIRREYAHVESSIFNVVRNHFLNKLLRRDRIFYTPEFEHLEKPARANLEWEIKINSGQLQ